MLLCEQLCEGGDAAGRPTFFSIPPAEKTAQRVMFCCCPSVMRFLALSKIRCRSNRSAFCPRICTRGGRRPPVRGEGMQDSEEEGMQVKLNGSLHQSL